MDLSKVRFGLKSGRITVKGTSDEGLWTTVDVYRDGTRGPYDLSFTQISVDNVHSDGRLHLTADQFDALLDAMTAAKNGDFGK
ncbi:hypothetical protein ACFQS3_02510 [Glycomyces mayteni]|uniref:Uncharacterized protein n=1 Tax=Glycomyces mayteni TaxID=543887 RepID=A0ABW2D3I5_9ACTN|nr:hypothetical protein GCM10025732_48010 [Glycomyces mayteni]